MKTVPPNLPPIPAPWSRRWKEFRIRFVPLLTFAAMVGIAGAVWRNTVVPERVNPSGPCGVVGNCTNPAHPEHDLADDAVGAVSAATNGVSDPFLKD
jgi:hypothetical protein